jgi:hypothetical protein
MVEYLPGKNLDVINRPNLRINGRVEEGKMKDIENPLCEIIGSFSRDLKSQESKKWCISNPDNKCQPRLTYSKSFSLKLMGKNPSWISIN